MIRSRSYLAILGRGTCGCEGFAYLAGCGKRVALVEMADQLVPEDINILGATCEGFHAARVLHWSRASRGGASTGRRRIG
jgi:pyruvate/2-oxoglutarate dehydrogenase complex dihydrolipoamide dehydrogenase (E3) component